MSFLYCPLYKKAAYIGEISAVAFEERLEELLMMTVNDGL